MLSRVLWKQFYIFCEIKSEWRRVLGREADCEQENDEISLNDIYKEGEARSGWSTALRMGRGKYIIDKMELRKRRKAENKRVVEKARGVENERAEKGRERAGQLWSRCQMLAVWKVNKSNYRMWWHKLGNIAWQRSSVSERQSFALNLPKNDRQKREKNNCMSTSISIKHIRVEFWIASLTFHVVWFCRYYSFSFMFHSVGVEQTQFSIQIAPKSFVSCKALAVCILLTHKLHFIVGVVEQFCNCDLTNASYVIRCSTYIFGYGIKQMFGMLSSIHVSLANNMHKTDYEYSESVVWLCMYYM